MEPENAGTNLGDFVLTAKYLLNYGKGLYPANSFAE